MFKTKTSKKLWTILIIVVVLVAISVILQAQILSKLQDLQTFILKSYYIQDANPLPAIDAGAVFDGNPLPAYNGIEIMDANPLPPKEF